MSKVTTYEIKKGITLTHIQAEQFKTVSVGVHFHRPLTKKEASANALLTSVMRRGNRKLQDAVSLNRYLQELYGAYFDADVRKKGEDQIVSFTISTVADSYLPAGKACCYDAIKMLFEMILNPQLQGCAFRTDYVEQEKINLINDIKAQINDKRTYTLWRLIETMCKNEAYSIYELGTTEDVEVLTPESLYVQYQTVLTESPIDIFVTGNANIDEIKSLAESYFAEINPKVTEYPKTVMYQPKEKCEELTECYDVSQAKLSIGFSTGIAPKDPEYYALMVYNSVFGSGAHSKLFNNVREKLSLAYYASSRLERFKGMMVVSSGIEYQNKEKAEAEIFAQADAMCRGDISDYEMDVSIKSIVNYLRCLCVSSSNLAVYYLGQAISGTNISLEEMCQKIESVTKQDVINVAKKIKPEMVYVMKGKEVAQ